MLREDKENVGSEELFDIDYGCLGNPIKEYNYYSFS
jgi:hypothetical protein